MARKSRKQRNEEQRARQANVREQARTDRKPGRNDFARVLLWQMIRAAQTRQRDPRKVLDDLRNTIVRELERQGFDLKASEDAFEDIAEKYSSGIKPFRPKPHLCGKTGGDANP